MLVNRGGSAGRSNTPKLDALTRGGAPTITLVRGDDMPLTPLAFVNHLGIFVEHKYLAYLKRHRRRCTINKARSIGRHTKSEWLALVASTNGICVLCGVMPMEAKDHIVSLFRGGSDAIGNIQPVCHSCNSRKGAR